MVGTVPEVILPARYCKSEIQIWQHLHTLHAFTVCCDYVAVYDSGWVCGKCRRGIKCDAHSMCSSMSEMARGYDHYTKEWLCQWTGWESWEFELEVDWA